MPYQFVKSKLLKVDSEMFRYAIDNLKGAGKERNVHGEKNYITTVLYNAANTIGLHYSAKIF